MSKRAAQVPPTHTEVITWHEAPALPDQGRTVLARFKGLDGARMAFFSNGVWYEDDSKLQFLDPLLRWAELGKTAQGYLSVDFTQLGRQLPPGVYELRATTKPTPGG
jgi:hypothetical protein